MRTLPVLWLSLSMMLALGLGAQSSEPLTLNKCLDLAKENNINLRQIQWQRVQAKANLTQSWARLFPTLNISTSASENFGLNFDPNSLTLQSSNYTSMSLGASSSLNVFDGLQRYHTIRSGSSSYKAAQLDFQQALDDLYLNVADLFLQVVFAEERLSIAQKQLELLQAQVERTQLLYESGSLVKGEYLSMKAQAASQETQVITAQNALNIAKLSLAQALNIEDTQPDIQRPDFGALQLPKPTALPAAQLVYEEAVGIRPAVEAAGFRVDARRYDLATSRGAYLPNLNFNANMGTVYSELRKQNPFDPTSPPIPLGEQLRQNNAQTLSFGLSIPIFNGLSVRTQVQQAKIGLETAKLNLENEKLQLKNTIFRAYADAQAAYAVYRANLENAAALEEAFTYAQERFELQAIQPVEYNDAATRLFNAKAELLIAEFDYIFKTLVLEFYRGKRYDF